MRLGSRIVGLAVVVALVVGALAWNAAEAHYRGCVEAAVARTEGVRTPSKADQILNGAEAAGKPRMAAVKGCSRLP